MTIYDDILHARCGAEDIADGRGFIHSHHPEAIHHAP